MKIIDPTFEYIAAPSREEAYRVIATAMRNCYRAELNAMPATDEQAVEKAVKLKHLSMLEFVDVSVNITCDRGVTHELVRHRLCSFAQESTRYCVAGHMKLSTRNPHLDMTIAELFSNKENSKNGAWKRIVIRCMDESTGLVTYSKIKDIHHMGLRRVIKLKTRLGYEIELTGDHEILTSDGWAEAATMELRDKIAINGTDLLYKNKDWLFHHYNTLQKTAVQIANEFGFTTSVIKKWVKKHDLPRKPKSYFNKGRAAWNKGLSVEDPRVAAQAKALNEHKWRGGRYTETERKERIKIVSKSTYRHFVDTECALCKSDNALQVHHIDRNRENNKIDNLETLCASCHQRVHEQSLLAVHYDEIVLIEDAGMTAVYDIEMAGPNKNFVANGIVVHNCNYSGEKFGRELTFVRPSWVLKDPEWTTDTSEKYQDWLAHMLVSEKAYLAMLDHGASAQEARSVLPNSLAAKIAVKANLREWIHIFRMRCDIPAHPDMRVTMIPILVSMLDLYPVVFQPVYNWLSQKGALK